MSARAAQLPSFAGRAAVVGVGWTPFSRASGVTTFTGVHRPFVAGFADDVPYAVGWVDLVEQAGLRVFADLAEVAAGDVRIGMPVEVTFTEREGWGPIPSFRPPSQTDA